MKKLYPVLKITLCLPFVWLTNTPAIGQSDQQPELQEEIVIPLSDPDSRGKLIVNQVFGSLSVTGYSGDTVIIIARQKSLKSNAEVKNGLRRISQSTLDLDVEESANVVRIVSGPHGDLQSNPPVNLEIMVPQDFDLKLNSIQHGDTYVTNVSGELEVTNNEGNITMASISGAAIVDSVHGIVKVSFDKLNQNTSMAFSSFSKSVDVTLPKEIAVNIKAKTVEGDVYTDFDIVVEDPKSQVDRNVTEGSYKVKLERWVQGAINGGGQVLTFKSFAGDIFIRQSE